MVHRLYLCSVRAYLILRKPKRKKTKHMILVLYGEYDIIVSNDDDVLLYYIALEEEEKTDTNNFHQSPHSFKHKTDRHTQN